MSSAKHIVISAGEASGDLHASLLIKALQTQQDNLHFHGIGGPKCRALGMHALIHAETLSVVGILEIARQFFTLRSALKTMQQFLTTQKPDLVVLVDFSGFNLRLAKYAHQARIQVVYYVSPQVWAWRKRRIKTIKRYVDHMIVFFPFEEKLYQEAGVPVSYVGHPLAESVQAEQTPAAFKRSHQIGSGPLIGLMPGSRNTEIRRLLPKMLATLPQLKATHPTLQCILIEADTASTDLIDGMLASYQDFQIQRIPAGSSDYSALAACDCVIVASGTATLELALLQTPMVIVYQLDPISYHIANALVDLPYYGLCNIAAGEAVVPECIQSDCTPDQIATSTLKTLELLEQVRIRTAFSNLKSTLQKDAINQAAELITSQYL